MESKQEWQSDYIGALIQDGFYDKLVIIGFPYDEGAKRSGTRGGSDYGPDSFRRFVKDIGSITNPEFNVDIAKGLPKISDYGNIQINLKPGQPAPSLQQLHEKLTTKVGLCISRGNLPFIVGGSREIFGAVADACLKQEKKKTTFISISHSLDVEPLLDMGVPHQSSNKRYLLEKMNQEENTLIEFGLSGLTASASDIAYFKSKNNKGKIYWHESIIKAKPSASKVAFTQAGQLFEQLLEEQNSDKKVDQIYISFNLENVEGATGVSTSCISGGLKAEEAIEICYLSGLITSKVVAFDVSEYNPFVEDWRTGRLVASMFYYFALGLSQRLQQ